MLTLACGQTDVWSCFYRQICDEALLNRYRAMLSEGERQRELRFRLPEHRRCYLVTRALLRTVLSRYAKLDPAAWSFAVNAYGKPEIANPYQANQGLSFNLSHTDGLIVLGIAAGGPIGVDAENMRSRPAPLRIAPTFFATEERVALRSLALDEQQERFFSYWTLKEAYIKARGMGLSIPLDKISFGFYSSRSIDVSFHPSLNDVPSNWRFRLFRPSLDHLAALCTEGDELIGWATEIAIRKLLPLREEEIVTCPVLRESGCAPRAHQCDANRLIR
jgi:4'-phosphopantetheinyl transferase